MERYSTNREYRISRPDIIHLLVIVALTLCCIIITAVSFSQHMETAYPQIFFFPILYATYYYTWRGIIVAGVCAVAYEALVYLYFSQNAFSLGSTIFQTLIFICVAAGVAYFIEKLKISETRYHSIFEFALHGAVIFDKNNFAIRLTNTRFKTLLGYSADELARMNFSTLFLNSDEQHRFFTELGSGEDIKNFDTVLVTKTGAPCHVILSWSMIDEYGVNCSVVDINECQSLRTVLDDTYTQYEQVIENSPIGIVILKDRKILFANPAFSTFSEYKPDEIIGTELSSLIHNDDLEEFHVFANPLETKTPPALIAEFRFISKSGGTKLAMLFFTPIIQKGHNPAVLINIVDSTEWEKQLGSSRQPNEEQRDIIKAVAQELRTPLQPIMGYLHLLIQDPMTYGITDETRQILDRCIKSVDQERQIINQMLELSVLDSGDAPLEYSVFPVLDLIRKIIETGGYILKAEININVPQELTFEADVHKISMVIDAMIANAVTYSKPPKKIWIIYRIAPLHPFHEIEIQDNGLGITDSQLDEIFTPIQPADAHKQKRKYDRVGFSLAIAKKYIQMHGGYISVDSIKNIGSTFTIHIPKQKPDGGEHPET
ncbi:MAG: PAS domain-containing sensor histidine kinase [Methanoregula sp.]|nr:PAS domain-containing sensor histidine kinase [Methanoregula sp.]